MGRILLFAIALVSAAVISCVREEASPGGDDGKVMTFHASIERGESTKTTMDIVDNTGTIKWAKKDQISILNSENGFDLFSLSAGNGTAAGEFTGNFSSGTSSKGIAVYPAGRHSYSGTELTVNLPSSYGDGTVSYSGNTNAIMMAEAEGANLPFRHLGGLVCFTVVHLPEGTDEVSLSGSGISGDFIVKNGVITKADNAEDCTVSYLFSDFVPVEGSKNRRTFYFPLPTGKYEGFTVNIISGNSQRTASISFGEPKTLDRADFVKFPDLDADKLPVSNIRSSSFDCLNLDYPGLEEVRSYYKAGNLKRAAEELLEYYRNRSDIKNIDVSASPSYSATDFNRAEQATAGQGYRFYVKNYVEDENGTRSDESDDIYYSFLGTDGGIDWTKVPEAVSGNQEWKQRYRMQWMLSQAKVYAVTKDEKYIEAWKEIMTSFMSVCDNYKDGGKYITYTQPNKEPYNVAWAALQLTARLEALLTVFEYYKHSENFTPEWLMTYLGYVYDHVCSLLANPYSSAAEYSNITTAQHSAKLKAGLYMPEFKDAEKWLEEGADALVDDVNRQFNSDGVLCEFDYGYHVGTLNDYIDVYNAVQTNLPYRPGLGSIFPSDYISRLRNAAEFVQDYIYPDYTVEGFSDTRPANVSESSILRNLSAYDRLFPDGHFEYMSTKTHDSGTVPSADLRIYPASGYYMFRSGWGKDDMMLIHKNNYDPEQRYHNQWDNGTISLYRKGRRFMPDASVPTYGGSDELDALRKQYASTAMHSTISRNGNPHNKRGGKCLGSGKAYGYEYVVTENEFETFSDNTSLIYRRAVFFVDKEFFVLVDDVYGTRSGGDIMLKMMLGDGTFASEYVCPQGDGVVPFTVYSNYPDNNNMYYKTFVSNPSMIRASKTKAGTDFYVNDVVTLAEYDSEKIERAMYQVTLGKPGGEGKTARFITVIHPIGRGSEGENMVVDAEFADGGYSAGSASVKVSIDGTVYNLAYTLQ